MNTNTKQIEVVTKRQITIGYGPEHSLIVRIPAGTRGVWDGQKQTICGEREVRVEIDGNPSNLRWFAASLFRKA